MAADYETAQYALFRYPPSLAAAVLFTILFAATTFIHTYQLFRSRTWFFIPLLIGGYFETVGYIGRVLCSSQTPDWSLGAFIVQAVLLLVAPALFAASIYMELGRIVRLVRGESAIFIPVRRMTLIFVLGDVVSFMTQAAGAGLEAGKTAADINTGQDIILAGLGIQIICFGVFVSAAVSFKLRFQRLARTGKVASVADVPWERHLNALFASSALILVRSVLRMVEFGQGNDGYIQRHEWFLYVFDGVLMLGVLVLFNWVHPAQIGRLLKERAAEKGGGDASSNEVIAVDERREVSRKAERSRKQRNHG